MTTGERMKARRKEIGLSAEQVAEYLGVSPTTIYRYEKGDIEKVPGEILPKLSAALKTTPAFLMGWDDGSELTQIGAVPYVPSTQQIPLLGRVAAGSPMYAEENIEGYIPLDRDDGHKYFGLRVRGDSMTAAGMDDGDIIVVRQQDMVEEGDMAVVLVNGYDATVKYWHRQGNTVILTPKSYNPEHQPQIYDAKKVPIRVLGRVVQIRKEV